MKILDTEETTHQFNLILKEAQEYLIIICPYIGVKEQSIKMFDKALARVLFSYIIRRKDIKKELLWDYKACDEHFDNANTNKCGYGKLDYLHAKIYMNEKECLITSLNAIDGTKDVNYEIGVSFTKELNPEQYKQAEKLALEIILKSDVKNKQFAHCIDRYETTMGSLYAKIVPQEKEQAYKEKYGDLVTFYEQHLCKSALKMRTFAKVDFYKHVKSVLLRSTQLSLAEYYKLHQMYAEI